MNPEGQIENFGLADCFKLIEYYQQNPDDWLALSEDLRELLFGAALELFSRTNWEINRLERKSRERFPG
ncbi:MAG: hypothetical protein JW991_04060 [Candidatus Pacebacteria bacterium]|nr:hypothetical protein [Candidatus Paceibacterota bacterium]